MSIVLTVLLTALKIVGILLLVFLLLLIIALSLPTGVRLEYQNGSLVAAAQYGPLRIRLYPRPVKKETEKARRQKPPRAQKSSDESARETKPVPAPEPKKLPPKPTPAQKPAAAKKKSAEASKEDQEGEPPVRNRRVQALLDHFREDPLGMIEAILGHVAFTGGRVLRGIHVHHLRVFWTVTAADDAAATAIRYGQQITVLNNLLSRAREYMDIRSDSLRLEPDFTGERKGERAIACTVYMHPIVLVLLAPRLLFRIWRDPSFAGVLF